MEHANATAIEMSAEGAKSDPVTLASLTAHEFFHLWNVKRIRPQSLEPIDYTREQYTPSLWFSEGITSTVADYMLLRANLLDESRWLRYLEHEIGVFERRPAHLTQSVEDSSIDTWLEKYPTYGLPQRSISYYNKGELIGVLLDLAIRDATQGHKSLRDVFRWMNRNYAQKHKFFPDSEGVRQAVEAVTGKDFKEFFNTCVTSAAPLPYNHYLKTVGLELKPRRAVEPYAGFVAVRNFDGPAVVAAVDDNSEAMREGLATGDVILLVNGKPLGGNLEDRVAAMRVGASVKLRVAGRDGQRDIKFKLGSREEEKFSIVSAPTLTAEQRARRAAWLTADDQGPRDTPKGAMRAQASRAPKEAGPAPLGSRR
jgi:predicted metalloprotease with PDZ domain